MDKKARTKAIVLIVIFIALIVGLSVLSLPYLEKLKDPAIEAQVEQWVRDMGFWGLLATFGVQVLQVIIAFIPGEPVEILAGALYGVWGGFALCLAGCALASFAIFSLSKRFGRGFICALFGEERVESWRWLNDGKRRDLIVFIVFLIPGTPKDMLTYVAGISSMSAGRFVLLSCFARIPSVLSSTIIGSSLIEGDWRLSLVIFLVTALIGVLGILYKDRVLDYCRKIAGRS